MSKGFKLGIFDSGVGGLTAYKEIKKILPELSVVYLGDTARVPYGNRSIETLKEFALQDLKFLESKGVSAVVVACNSLSATVLNVIKENTKLPVYDVITPVMKKIKNQDLDRVGLMGTRATVKSRAYGDIKQRIPAPLLVPLIEEGFLKGALLEAFLKHYLSDLNGKIDMLILGCTHYPIIKNEIKKFFKCKVEMIDPAETLAQDIYVNFKGIKSSGLDQFYLSDLDNKFIETANIFLGRDYNIEIKKATL